VSVTRQFVYEAASKKSIDLALLVNGLLTATAELKNPLTNQSIEHAKVQYDRTGIRTTFRCLEGRLCTSQWIRIWRR